MPIKKPTTKLGQVMAVFAFVISLFAVIGLYPNLSEPDRQVDIELSKTRIESIKKKLGIK